MTVADDTPRGAKTKAIKAICSRRPPHKKKKEAVVSHFTPPQQPNLN
jgi:hypothetical protein